MKTIVVPDVGEVDIKKSARAKRMIIAVQPDGKARVTIPSHVPYIVGKQYVLKNRKWLIEHANQVSKPIIDHAQQIGKTHHIEFKDGEKVSSRVGKSVISVTVPAYNDITDEVVQKEALKASTRAIRRQAEAYLPSRLYEIANNYGYSFKEVRCKALKTRWGSCSSEKIINLNIWLMQLDNELIDYVLVHELTHLNHPNHQVAFWSEVGQMIPDYKQKRKILKQHKPALTLA
jgi:predicted metal-dependent hydrolase